MVRPSSCKRPHGSERENKMSWPLTGRALADFNRMLSDWKQYSTFPFIGPDDIDRLYNVLLSAGLHPQLEDVGNRPQYWLLQLVSQAGNSVVPPSSGTIVEVDDVMTGLIQLVTSDNVTGLFCPNLTDLTNVGTALAVEDNSSMTTVYCPLLANVAGIFDITFNPIIPAVSFPSLVTTSEHVFIEANPLLTSVSLPLWVPTNGKSQFFDGNALDAVSVNHILARCVANAGFVSGTLDLSGGTNAAPTGQGIADAATLSGRGVTVNTN